MLIFCGPGICLTRSIAVLPTLGVFAMRIIDWKVLKTMQPYSRQHILRLEKAGVWPKRVKLGNNRIGWVYDEIVAHLEGLAAKR